jgi:hypothetical protein
MKGEPSPPELINRLARLALSLGGLEQRKMFQHIRGTSDERRRLMHACVALTLPSIAALSGPC